MDLMRASNQWASRPADERFWTIKDMMEKARADKVLCEAVSLEQGIQALRVGQVLQDGNLLVHNGNNEYRLNNWTFNQLCKAVHAPTDYLANLGEPGLVSECLNTGLDQLDENDRSSGIMLFHKHNALRSITSNRYSRIFDIDILERLLPLTETQGWKAPPAYPTADDPRARPATAADLTRSTWLKEGDMIGPAGLYRGDRNMFCFLVNDDARIDDGSEGGISRGFFVGNSEVGGGSFFYIEFGFRNTCGNHIVWGAQDVREVRLRHVGADTPERAFDMLMCQLTEYADASMEGELSIIKSAKKFIVGRDKDEVLDFLFGKRLMTRKLAEKAVHKCISEEPSLNPFSMWGVVQGLTRVSQEADFADKRNELDNITPKLLKVAVAAAG